jgi:hypothetical protein
VIRLLGHTGAAVAGYIAASISAGICYIVIMVVAAQFGGGIAQPSELSEADQFGQLAGFAWLAIMMIGILSFLPSLAAIAILTVLRRSDVISFVIAGIAVSTVAVFIAVAHVPFMEKQRPDLVSVLAGAAGGAAFWATYRKLAPTGKTA